jgi:hypothetical protein
MRPTNQPTTVVALVWKCPAKISSEQWWMQPWMLEACFFLVSSPSFLFLPSSFFHKNKGGAQ